MTVPSDRLYGMVQSDDGFIEIHDLDGLKLAEQYLVIISKRILDDMKIVEVIIQ